MERVTEPDLPDPLPRPLSDPQLRYRRLLLISLPFLWASVFIVWLTPNIDPRTLRDTAETAGLAVTFAVLLCTLRLLPRRATNAIYLRSFRNDARTGGLRTAAQAALGPGFRLSGIRDPRRRWPALIRHLLYISFLIRYAQPKFMNLEAGPDWKARLWRSLGAARCALIDVTDLTAFLREEVNLAVPCLGLHRVLFVGDDSRTADQWRRVVLAALGAADVRPDRVRVAVWADTPAGRAAFRGQVQAFADRLPADPPGLNAAAFPATDSAPDPGGRAETGEGWLPFLLATLIGAAVAGAVGWAEDRMVHPGLLWFLPVVTYNALALLLLLQYFVVCGSQRQRLRLAVTFAFAATLAGLPVVLDFVAPVEGVRIAAARVESANNLKQVGAALYQYEAEHRHPPPLAVCRPDGTPLLSWRVLLLPYLGDRERDLFAFFKLDEPWDGPNNRQFLTNIPPAYLSPYKLQDTDPTGTYCQALTGPGTAWGERRPADRAPQPYLFGGPWLGGDGTGGGVGVRAVAFEPLFRLEDVRNSSHPVVLAVEAAEPVPWTKPADLDCRPAAGDWVKQLGATRFGFSVLLSDGSVRSFRNRRELRPEQWAELVAWPPDGAR